VFFTFFVQFLTLFLSRKGALRQQVLDLVIVSYKYLQALKVPRKSVAAR